MLPAYDTCTTHEGTPRSGALPVLVLTAVRMYSSFLPKIADFVCDAWEHMHVQVVALILRGQCLEHSYLLALIMASSTLQRC